MVHRNNWCLFWIPYKPNNVWGNNNNSKFNISAWLWVKIFKFKHKGLHWPPNQIWCMKLHNHIMWSRFEIILITKSQLIQVKKKMFMFAHHNTLFSNTNFQTLQQSVTNVLWTESTNQRPVQLYLTNVHNETQHSLHIQFLCSWVHATWINVNNCPTRCDYIQFYYISATQFYMFRMIPSSIVRSTCKL